jgi:hypothetical protein
MPARIRLVLFFFRFVVVWAIGLNYWDCEPLSNRRTGRPTPDGAPERSHAMPDPRRNRGSA